MTTASDPVVVTENLSKKYGDFEALSDLTIHVNRGEIMGFIGPNGAGKTTTIKILVGLSKPTSGVARIAGIDCSANAGKIKHLVGYMPDRFGSYDNMRVREYLDFFGAIFRIPLSKRKRRIDEVLDVTNATYMQDKFVESLSHGMQQRVGIARTLLHDPQVLILDEPANGLDPSARIEMREILLRLASEGKTLIVTSHILPELSRICDTIAIVTGGRLRAFGTLDEVMRDLCPIRKYEVQLVRDSDVDLAAAAIQEKVPSAQVAISRAERILRFPTSDTEEQLSHLLAALVQRNIQISQFREVAGDLEDAFLSVANVDSASPSRGTKQPEAATTGAVPA